MRAHYLPTSMQTVIVVLLLTCIAVRFGSTPHDDGQNMGDTLLGGVTNIILYAEATTPTENILLSTDTEEEGAQEEESSLYAETSDSSSSTQQQASSDSGETPKESKHHGEGSGLVAKGSHSSSTTSDDNSDFAMASSNNPATSLSLLTHALRRHQGLGQQNQHRTDVQQVTGASHLYRLQHATNHLQNPPPGDNTFFDSLFGPIKKVKKEGAAQQTSSSHYYQRPIDRASSSLIHGDILQGDGLPRLPADQTLPWNQDDRLLTLGLLIEQQEHDGHKIIQENNTPGGQLLAQLFKKLLPASPFFEIAMSKHSSIADLPYKWHKAHSTLSVRQKGSFVEQFLAWIAQDMRRRFAVHPAILFDWSGTNTRLISKVLSVFPEYFEEILSQPTEAAFAVKFGFRNFVAFYAKSTASAKDGGISGELLNTLVIAPLFSSNGVQKDCGSFSILATALIHKQYDIAGDLWRRLSPLRKLSAFATSTSPVVEHSPFSVDKRRGCREKSKDLLWTTLSHISGSGDGIRALCRWNAEARDLSSLQNSPPKSSSASSHPPPATKVGSLYDLLIQGVENPVNYKVLERLQAAMGEDDASAANALVECAPTSEEERDALALLLVRMW